MQKRTLWQRIRTIWITTGLTLTVVFVVWCLIAYQASGDAKAATVSDGRVTVTRSDGVWRFAPAAIDSTAQRRLIFYPGAMVDARAYAPYLRSLADSGFTSYLVELPKRGAFGGADDPRVLDRTLSVIRENSGTHEWVLAGHSKGAVVTASMAARKLDGVVGIVLIGTTHPRDVDLSASTLQITKVVGTRDGVASMQRSEENKHLLPATTRWVVVEGGNHSQFGWYGFQPGDKFSSISREDQQRQTTQALLGAVAER
jgi:pimeloyl-ACP methyl ester carboxylesterase